MISLYLLSPMYRHGNAVISKIGYAEYIGVKYSRIAAVNNVYRVFGGVYLLRQVKMVFVIAADKLKSLFWIYNVRGFNICVGVALGIKKRKDIRLVYIGGNIDFFAVTAFCKAYGLIISCKKRFAYAVAVIGKISAAEQAEKAETSCSHRSGSISAVFSSGSQTYGNVISHRNKNNIYAVYIYIAHHYNQQSAHRPPVKDKGVLFLFKKAQYYSCKYQRDKKQITQSVSAESVPYQTVCLVYKNVKETF